MKYRSISSLLFDGGSKGIVPWRVCEPDARRIDVHNGLLPLALWKAAFERGLVSFLDEGTSASSPALSEAVLRDLRRWSARTLNPRQREKLTWHFIHIVSAAALQP